MSLNFLQLKHKFALIILPLAISVLFLYSLKKFLFSVEHIITIDKNLSIELKYEEDILSWIDPVIYKEILIKNHTTDSELLIKTKSIEWNLYFYLNDDILQITDQYLGTNKYDYNSLKLRGNQDCFRPDSYCGGLNDKMLQNLGNPILIFNSDGFLRP